MKQQEVLGLSGTDTTQDKEALSPEPEETIERGGKLRKEVIVVDNGDEVTQGLDEQMHKEEVPDQPVQAPPPPPPPVANDSMMEDPEPTQLGDDDLFIGRYDVMIDVGELYSKNQETDH